MVIDFNDVQSPKAQPDIWITEAGMVIEEMDEHLANAAYPMDVIVLGMMTVWSKGKSVEFQ